MLSDTGDRLPTPPGPDLWRLPKILELTAARVRYDQPRYRVENGEVREFTEAVEIRITTDEPFPIRALSPVLYVGRVGLTDAEEAGDDRRYRFIAADFEKLKPGAPITLGWTTASRRKEKTGYVLPEIVREETRETGP